MKNEIISVVIIWLFAVGSAFWWNMSGEKKANERLAFETARAFYQQLVTTRTWNANHGGVYVPVTKNVQPNPYLEDSQRDITTEDNIKFTKINPAYMTREIAEIASKKNRAIQFHITSLKPIRPENIATEWEKNWLISFEAGEKEKGAFLREGSKSFFRYMAPLSVEKSCLQCHAKQGYKIGDIRGGISVTLPNFSNRINLSLITGYGFATCLGVIFILTAGWLLHEKRQMLLKANQTLKDEVNRHQETINQLSKANSDVKQLRGIVPICMHCKEIRNDKGYWTQLEEYISENSEAEFSHGVCDKCVKIYYDE